MVAKGNIECQSPSQRLVPRLASSEEPAIWSSVIILGVFVALPVKATVWVGAVIVRGRSLGHGLGVPERRAQRLDRRDRAVIASRAPRTPVRGLCSGIRRRLSARRATVRFDDLGC